MYIDKYKKLSNLNDTPVIFELGCGDNKVHKEAITIDSRDFPCVDIVGDVFEILKDIPDCSVNSLYAYHFVEHIDDLELLLSEMVRVCKYNSIIKLSVPHFSNPFFYSDPTHKRTFGLYTFFYFFDCKLFKRKVPDYCRIPEASLIFIKLIFTSYKPNYLRYIFKKFLQTIFNLSSWTQEFYEEMFANIFPCYELIIKIKKSEIK